MNRLAWFGLLAASIMSTSALVASKAYSAEILVHPDGSGDFPTIQEAVWASANGDVISLTPGTYLENEIDLVGRRITIRALEGPGTCQINGQGQTVFILDGAEDETTVLSGLDIESALGSDTSLVQCIQTTPTIQDCTFRATTGNNYTGVYAVGDGPFLTRCTFRETTVGLELRGVSRNSIVDCRFEDNILGMMVTAGRNLRIEQCEFVGNQTGLASLGGAQLVGDVLISECQFEANRFGAVIRGNAQAELVVRESSFARNDLYGASLLVADLVVESCEFVENGTEASPTSPFGGLEAAGGSVVDCLFEANRAMNAGGLRGATLVRDCVFRNNVANGLGEEDGSGGAIWGGTTCENTLFVGNRAGHGGAIYGGGNVIRDCTFVANVGFFTSAIEVTLLSVHIERTIITGNQGGDPIGCADNDPSALITCTNIWGNESGDWIGCVAGQLGQDGNITDDPLFCDPTMEDYHLASGSPCLEQNNDCGTMGAFDEGCSPTPVLDASWGTIKAGFYDPDASGFPRKP